MLRLSRHNPPLLRRQPAQPIHQPVNLPIGGVYLPLALVDAEAGLSVEDRCSRQPFGILMLFQKKP